MPRNFLDYKVISEDMDMIYRARKNWDEFKESSVFISGASGMLASYIVMFLIYLNEKHNFKIKIFAGIRQKHKASMRFGLFAERDYFNIIEGDICDFNLEVKLDYIIHAASLASPQFYGRMPVETMLPNIVGTYKLMEYSKEHSIKSFLFFSSGAVYGDSEKNIITEDLAGEFDFLAPGGVYGESKRCGEAMCFAYSREYGIPVKCIRIHHTYGPTLDLENDKRAFSEFIKNIINNQNIVLKSDGSQKRAFCYLTDGIAAILKVLLNGKNQESYNLANSEQFVSIKQLAEILISLYPEKKLHIDYRQREDKGYLNLAQTSSVVCSTEKIQKLGCKFEVDIREGFKRTIEYFLEL